MRNRKPVQLLLAFFGEMVVGRTDDPVPASVLIDVLDGAGIAGPTTRASLDRMRERGLLGRVRRGREIGFHLTDRAKDVLNEAAERVERTDPFAPRGAGWTLVTFSVAERHRSLRHQLRASLTWAGFAPLRDGLWVAPGAIDLASALGPLQDDLPPGTVQAFRASEIEGYEMGDAVASAWQIDEIRAEHELFLREWEGAADYGGRMPALTARTALVADWLALLRADPGLPAGHLGPHWPADRSTRVFRERHAALHAASDAEFLARMGAIPA
ncbi:PaaX family transcriptional regulator C-terminal domain-containing protein [Microbacterium sp.]|uniref:PaaX family transcriptional regulator n=1 Tax=Microbacterium sp. TaxID=51671 RepID=UPI0025EF8768|nr:PaaX family transcriptional regulator C-terminal domain-containing protein [Microbacterium sp.]